MRQKNIIYIILGMLSLVVLFQGYLFYELKQESGKNSSGESLKISSVPSAQLSADPFRNFTPDSWDPFAEIQRMQHEMQRTFGNFNSHFMHDPIFKDAFKGITISPLSDIQDKGDHYSIIMNLPGAQDQHIEIDAKDNRLSISAKVHKQSDRNTSGFMRKERYAQHFQRSFILPDDADSMNIEHEYKNGVLNIKVAKKNR